MSYKNNILCRLTVLNYVKQKQAQKSLFLQSSKVEVH